LQHKESVERVAIEQLGPEQLEPGDLELVRAAACGDHGAFHTLVDRHAQNLFRLALSLTPSRADAEDLCQETFAGAFAGLNRFKGQSSVRTWLTSILMRQAAKAWHRSRHTRKAVSLQGAEEGTGWEAVAGIAGGSNLGGSGPTIPSEQAAVDRKIDLEGVLGRLDPPHREILLLREMQQMSYEEIATSLGVPRGTVESRLHRARAELKRHLKDYVE
jgi:RNA polymerase sigma-70 factor (ECF subfamily)